MNRAALQFLYAEGLKRRWFDEEIVVPKRKIQLPNAQSGRDHPDSGCAPKSETPDDYGHSLCHGHGDIQTTKRYLCAPYFVFRRWWVPLTHSPSSPSISPRTTLDRGESASAWSPRTGAYESKERIGLGQVRKMENVGNPAESGTAFRSPAALYPTRILQS